jgi:hypothetical protein
MENRNNIFRCKMVFLDGILNFNEEGVSEEEDISEEEAISELLEAI